MHTEPQWHFRLFGGFEAQCGAYGIHRLRTAKTTALMGYMVAHPPHRFARSALCTLFWDDHWPERARNNLSVALNAIRHTFHLNETDTPLLLTDAQNVALNQDLFTADVLEFENALSLAQRASDPNVSYQYYALAARLYRGELMAGFYEPWITEKSVLLQLGYVHALHQLIELDLRRGNQVTAIEWSQRLVALKPFDPDALYTLTMLYLEQGLDDAAYQLCLTWQERYIRERGRRLPEKAHAALSYCLRSHGVGKPQRLPMAPTRQDKPELQAPPPTPAVPARPAREPSALPTPMTPLLGRERALDEVLYLLHQPDTRCVMLLGLGGLGKTRLAIEVAHRWAQQGTVCWVSLATLAQALQIPEAILYALGIPTDGDPLTQLRHCLRQCGDLLLVLDNLEHLLPEAAPLIAGVLRDAPRCRLLGTGRIPMNIDGETLYALTPLACEGGRDSPAVQLFVHRARQVAHDFRATDETLRIIGALCQQLDGIPLALELAASRLNVLSPRQMLESVVHRLDWLKTHRVDIPPRHREMRSVLDVAYATLPSPAQTLLRQLAATQGAWTLETMHAIFYAREPLTSVADALETLLSAGLVIHTADDRPRFRLLELVREYAQSLQSPDESRAAQQAISDWVRTQAAMHCQQAYTTQLPDWLAFWDAHKELLLETLLFLRAQGQTDALLTLLIQMERYLLLRPAAAWTREQLTLAVQATDASPDALCRSLCLLTRLHFQQESLEACRDWAQRALELAERSAELIDDETRDWALYWTVQIALTTREMNTVNAYWERLWSRYPCPDSPRLHLAIHYLAAYLEPGRHNAAWREQAVQFAHTQHDPLLLLDTIDALLESLIFIGDYARVRAYLHEAERLVRLLDSPTRLASVLYTRAYIDIQQGALDSAEALIASLFELDSQLGYHADSIRWLLGMLYRLQGRYAEALEQLVALAAQQEMAQRPHEAASAWDLAAVAALEMGDLANARRYAEHALHQRALQDDIHRLHYSLTIYYGVRGLTAPDPEAVRKLEECLRFWEEREMAPWRANTLYYLAAALATAGETARAHDALDAAIHLNETMGRTIALSNCRTLQAKLPNLP